MYRSLLSMSRQGQNRLAMVHRHLSVSPCSALVQVKLVAVGSKYTADYKNYATINGQVISWMHDVPLALDPNTKEANMVVEVPRWLNAKFEIDIKTPGNPIVQDVKKGKMRFVANLFPHKGYIHNYGAFPQTWEDPSTKDPKSGLLGDNDPLDVCEIGSQVIPTGLVVRVKILGLLALIDDGELDWKVIAINTADPLAAKLNDIDDVRAQCPGLLEQTRQWFRDYKLADGKPENAFAFNGNFLSAAETVEVVQSCQHHWEQLIKLKGGEKLPSIANSTVAGTPGKTEFDSKLLASGAQPDGKIPEAVDATFFRK